MSQPTDRDLDQLDYIPDAGDTHRFSPGHQRWRRAQVEARVHEVVAVLLEGLRGGIPLGDAVYAAGQPLNQAIAEVLRASIDDAA